MTLSRFCLVCGFEYDAVSESSCPKCREVERRIAMRNDNRDVEMMQTIAAGLVMIGQAIFKRYPMPDAESQEPEPQPLPFLGEPRMADTETEREPLDG
jgi:hypothetical protein